MVRLSDIRKSFPASTEAIARLESLLEETQGGGAEYSLEHLYEVLHPNSFTALAELLAWLTENNYVDRVYRVVSPRSGVGIQDFTSLNDVPDHIFDDETEGEVDVTDANIEVLYRIR